MGYLFFVFSALIDAKKTVLKRAEQSKKMENAVWMTRGMTRIYNSCSSCKVNHDTSLVNSLNQININSALLLLFSPKPLLRLSVSLGTTNKIAPQFRRFSLLCFCEIKGEEICKFNFTFNLFTYSLWRCDESSPWRLARRQSLKLQNATISKYLQLIFYYVM